VAACLNRLAAKGLVRRLGQSGLWELSHDFIARQFALLLSRIHPSPWSRVAAFVVPVAFGISLAGAVVAVPIYLQMTSTRAEAAELIPKLHRLQATYDRLNAELANRVYDPVEPDEDQLMQRSIFRIRQTEYSGRLKASDRKAEKYERDIASLVTEAKSLQEQIGLTKQELEMYKTLVAKDLASKLPLMRVSEHLADITIRIETNLREQQKVTEQIAAESGERDAFIMEWHRKLTEEIANVRSERDGVAARIASLQDPFLVLTAPQQSTFR
jgi:chromosome segregation ATPase